MEAFGGLRKWSIARLPTSVVLEGYPSVILRLSLDNFRQSQSSVGICTEILLGAGALGPAKGQSLEGFELSISGICDHPIKDRMPLMVSR